MRGSYQDRRGSCHYKWQSRSWRELGLFWTMTFKVAYHYLMYAGVLLSFVAALCYVDTSKLSLGKGALAALILIVFGASFGVIGRGYDLKAVLLFDSTSVWFGSSSVAMGYGLLLFSVARLGGFKRRLRGEEAELEQDEGPTDRPPSSPSERSMS
jgi:hypothetical protein